MGPREAALQRRPRASRLLPDAVCVGAPVPAGPRARGERDGAPQLADRACGGARGSAHRASDLRPARPPHPRVVHPPPPARARDRVRRGRARLGAGGEPRRGPGRGADRHRAGRRGAVPGPEHELRVDDRGGRHPPPHAAPRGHRARGRADRGLQRRLCELAHRDGGARTARQGRAAPGRSRARPGRGAGARALLRGAGTGPRRGSSLGRRVQHERGRGEGAAARRHGRRARRRSGRRARAPGGLSDARRVRRRGHAPDTRRRPSAARGDRAGGAPALARLRVARVAHGGRRSGRRSGASRAHQPVRRERRGAGGGDAPAMDARAAAAGDRRARLDGLGRGSRKVGRVAAPARHGRAHRQPVRDRGVQRRARRDGAGSGRRPHARQRRADDPHRPAAQEHARRADRASHQGEPAPLDHAGGAGRGFWCAARFAARRPPSA